MKESRIVLGLLILVILLVIGHSTYNMFHAGSEEDYYNVAVLLDDSGNERWAAFKEGMAQGAAENQIHLDIVSTGTFKSFQNEKALLNRVLEGKIDGLILQDLYPTGAKDILSAISDSGTQIVLTETDDEGKYAFSSVTVDQNKVGETLAEAVVNENKKNDGVICGILFGDSAQSTIHQRMEGLCNVLDKNGIKISWQTSFAALDDITQRLDYLKNHPVDILIALENDETEAAAELLSDERGIPARLFGTGFSEKNVYFLDKGFIQTLIVPNEYYQGYRSIHILAAQMKYHTSQLKHDTVEFQTVTKEDVYKEEFEKILFPIVR